ALVKVGHRQTNPQNKALLSKESRALLRQRPAKGTIGIADRDEGACVGQNAQLSSGSLSL
ncbi:hypothetical protein, partial [Thauera sp. 28]|uniref:hypothetical protein n=1 Tax=Thauera sp. 28 TaxID=303682 RepID=UPI001E44884F